MAKKYIVRVASNVPYEYWQGEGDSYGEMLEVEAELRELKAGGDPAQDRAIQALTDGGVRTGLPGLNAAPKLGGTVPTMAALGLGAGRQAQQPSGDDAWKGVELGKLPDGTVITVHATGKHGPHVKAYIPATKAKVYANLPRGASAEQIDLATAIGLIEQKMAA